MCNGAKEEVLTSDSFDGLLSNFKLSDDVSYRNVEIKEFHGFVAFFSVKVALKTGAFVRVRFFIFANSLVCVPLNHSRQMIIFIAEGW